MNEKPCFSEVCKKRGEDVLAELGVTG